jgi:two-component system chemotaxis sensor kinase CheA
MKLFISEAEDLIQKTEEEILHLEENPSNLKPVQELFFTFHTLKGLTAMAGFDNLSKFCHHFESFLQSAKEKKVAVSKTSNFIDMLFESLDVLRSVIKKVKKGDYTDIDENFVEDIKDSFENFESDYDITFIHPLTNEEISGILKQKQNKAFKIYVRIEETCVFKKVRLFIIFRALNENGKICWTNPAPEALEKATLKNEFEIYFITAKNKTEISHTIDEILEIESIVIKQLESKEFENTIANLKVKWEQEKPDDVSIESRYEEDKILPRILLMKK